MKEKVRFFGLEFHAETIAVAVAWARFESRRVDSQDGQEAWPGREVESLL